MIEFSTKQILKSDLDKFFSSISSTEDPKYVRIPHVSNSWLLLYILKNYQVFFGRLKFRGGIPEDIQRLALMFCNEISLYFGEPAYNENFKLWITLIISKNEEFAFQCKKFHRELDELRTSGKLWEAKTFAETFSKCFDYELTTDVNTLTKIREDLSFINQEDRGGVGNYFRENGDIELSEDLVVKDGLKKALLFKKIGKDRYLKSIDLTKTEARILTFLYGMRSHKGIIDRSTLAQRLSKKPKTIKSRVSSLNVKAREILNENLIIVHDKDHSFNEKLYPPN